MPTTTRRPASIEELRAEALQLLDERDMRFYDDNDVCKVRSNMTAGERIRLANREPLLGEESAAVFADATRVHAIPAMSIRDLNHFIHCAKFCPIKRVRG